MNLHRTKIIPFVFIFLLSACAKQAQLASPTTSVSPPTETSAPTVTLPALTETSAPPKKIPTGIPTEAAAEIPSNTDPALFGVLAKNEINALAAKIHEAIFTKVMDGLIANGNIIEYQVVASDVFPSGEGGLLAEIYYNVRTTDPSWLVDGGTSADDNWINDKCNRFDFVNTESEFQLKNRRTCN